MAFISNDVSYFTSLLIFGCLFLVVCLFVHVGAGACRDHERAMDVLELE